MIIVKGYFPEDTPGSPLYPHGFDYACDTMAQAARECRAFHKRGMTGVTCNGVTIPLDVLEWTPGQ